MKNDCLGLLGLLYVGQKAMIGESAINSFPAAKLVILAPDAKEGTKKMVKNAKNHHHFPLIEAYSKAQLGHALGHDEVAFVAITDKKAAEKIVLAALSKKGETDEK